MLGRFARGSFVVFAGAVVLAGFAADARAASFPEDGTLQNAGSVTMASLLGGGSSNNSLTEVTPGQGGGLQLTISDCQFTLPAGHDAVDVVLNEFQTSTASDQARFQNIGGAATITFTSDDAALLPLATNPTTAATASERGIGIPGAALTLPCVGTGSSIFVQAQGRSVTTAGAAGATSDQFVVRGLPGPVSGTGLTGAAVPALPPWAMGGLGLLLTGMGIVLARRLGRTTSDMV